MTQDPSPGTGAAPEGVFRHLLNVQSARLAPMRSRYFRRLRIAGRGPLLDLGCGYGNVTEELLRRARGPVVALDRQIRALAEVSPSAHRVVADAQRLPFAPESFDLIFSQFALMWMPPVETAAARLADGVRPGGDVLCIEPDFGGMIEQPVGAGLGELWRTALTRCGADPFAARKVIVGLKKVMERVYVDVIPPGGDWHGSLDLELLQTLPLTPAERARCSVVHASTQFLYLPVFVIHGKKAEGTSGHR